MPLRPHPTARKFVVAVVIGCVATLVIVSLLLIKFSPLSQRWAVAALRHHYHGNVTIRSFHVSLFPHIAISGEGLTLGDPEKGGGPPLVSIKRFSLDATWLGLLRHPRRVRHVRLEGLTINVQRRRHPGQSATKRRSLPPLYLIDVEADGTLLNISSDDPQKPPLVFAISKLGLQSVGVGRPMSFQATLTNPKPIGQIQASGNFGPWDPDDPGQTPVAGKYGFHNADLSTIHGIAGILTSSGQFKGQLDRIEVDGTTDTPHFALGADSNAESLKTQFHAIVDGSTGKTMLQPVRAQLGHSLIIARGGVLRKKDVKGTTVVLDVTADDANLGDILLIAVKSGKPPMVGAIDLRTSFEVVPGTEDIVKRLKLHGNFTIQAAHFTDPATEKKIARLSASARGNPGQGNGQGVPSNFKGDFHLARGVISFSKLSFEVPGASVDLHGTYSLVTENLDLLGTVYLQAEASQMTTGLKSILLKPLDRLLKGKHAGTVVPVKISGNREHPNFGLQIGRLWKEIL